MTENRRKCISMFPIQRYGETPGSSECLRALSRRTTTCRERFERLINPNATDVTPVIPSAVEDPSPACDAASTRQQHATQPDTSKHVHQTVGVKRRAEVNLMFSSGKRARAIHPPVPQILSQLRVDMKMMSVPEDAMEARTDVEMETESVRSGTKKASSTWEDCADTEACLNTAGECRRCDANEVLTTVAGVGSEPTQMQECEVFEWRHRSKRSSIETVISTRMSYKAKRNRAQPSIVMPEYADAMRVSEHYASTLCTRTQRLMINSMMSKCRTRQPESYDTLSAFFHDWLERGVWTELPTDPRLNDGWCWQQVSASQLLSPEVSVRWLSGSVHMTTDAKHVENLAGLSEVKSTTSMGVVSCLDLSEPADCQSFGAENYTDVTVSVRNEHMQVVGSCKAQEEICVDQEAVPATMNKSSLQIEAEKLSRDIPTPSTVLVWIDGVWSGDSVSYKQLFAGTGRLKNHAIETPRTSRWETSDCRWGQDRDIDENSVQSASQ